MGQRRWDRRHPLEIRDGDQVWASVEAAETANPR